MHFPEFLYQLSARDQQVTWLDPTFSKATTGLAQAVIALQITQVPDGRVLVLKNLSMSAIPGLGQSSLNLNWSLRPPTGGDNRPIVEEHFTAAANVNRALNWSGELLIPPGWVLFANASFDAGAIANSVVGDALGILIPVANVQRL